MSTSFAFPPPVYRINLDNESGHTLRRKQLIHADLPAPARPSNFDGAFMRQATAKTEREKAKIAL